MYALLYFCTRTIITVRVASRLCKACSARGSIAVGSLDRETLCGVERGPCWNPCTRASSNLATPLHSRGQQPKPDPIGCSGKSWKFRPLGMAARYPHLKKMCINFCFVSCDAPEIEAHEANLFLKDHAIWWLHVHAPQPRPNSLAEFAQFLSTENVQTTIGNALL